MHRDEKGFSPMIFEDILLHMPVAMVFPLEIISKVVLTYQELKTTQVFLGKMSHLKPSDI
jgi:hypothetical protein